MDPIDDMILPIESDHMEDIEDSHPRRSHGSSNIDERLDMHRDSRDRGVGRRSPSPPTVSPSRERGSFSRYNDNDRDNKYDRRPSGSMGGVGANGGNGMDRRRSRSPARANIGGGAASAEAVRDRRVYVGNLSYDVRWPDLKDFMKDAGHVAHADVLLGPDGRSKGCGVVEYETAEDARNAIRKLNDVVLKGRPVFVREDRESENRIGASGNRNSFNNHHHHNHNNNYNSGRDYHHHGSNNNNNNNNNNSNSLGGVRQVFVANLPYSMTWRDLKDFFRKAGPVERADVYMDREMRSKGSGTVSFESPADVPRAISMFNGYEWHGRRIEVREDKYGPPGGRPQPTISRFDRGGSSYTPGAAYNSGVRDDRERYESTYANQNNNNNSRNDYTSRDDRDRGRGGRDDRYGGDVRNDVRNDVRSDGRGDVRADVRGAAPINRPVFDDVANLPIPEGPAAGSGNQIYIRNLPFTTTGQDLRDLFRTCGAIKMTEILEQDGRSKGSGVVRFEHFESADKAVGKFNGYVYGGRAIEVLYDRI